MSERTVDELVAAVAAGESIDWPSALAQVTTSEGLAVARSLHSLSHWSTATRGNDGVPAERRRRVSTTILEGARLLAIVDVFVAGANYASAAAASSADVGILFVVLVSFTAAAILLDRGGRDVRARALAGCYWTVAAAFALNGIAHRWAGSSGGAAVLVWARPEAFFAGFLWQFAREFPRVTHFSRSDRWCTQGAAVSVAIGAALFGANIVPHVAPYSWLATWCLPFDVLRDKGLWFWVLEFALAAPALPMMAWRARNVSPSERRRARLFLYGIAGAFSPVVLEVIAEGVSPGVKQLMRSPVGHMWGAWAIYPPLLALPVFTSYAVIVDNVLDVRVSVGHALRYLLTRWLVMWSAVVPLALLIVHAYRLRDEPLSVAFGSPLARALIWIDSAALVLLVFRSHLLDAIDRWALPGVEARSATLARMADLLSHSRTPIEVVAVLADGAARALQAPATAFLMRGGGFAPITDGISPPTGSLIPVLLSGARGPCAVDPRASQSYYSLITARDRDWIATNDIALLVPVMAGRSASEPLGVVALKHRRNALAFSTDDLRFLSAGATSATLAFEALLAERVAVPQELEELAVQCRTCGRVVPLPPNAGDCPCGGRWDRAGLPATLLQRFRVARLLGSGGMGVVYHAMDLTLHRDVAIKTLPLLAGGAADRLLDEARTMAALSHPHIAILYSAEMWRGTPMLVMEYCAGGTLADRLKRGPLPGVDAVAIVSQLADALRHVHAAGLFHGDIKPSNIGLAADGRPKFLDFGLARVAETVAHSRATAGTPAYLSPEVVDGAPSGPALDIWALSVVFFEAVVGAHPLLDPESSRRLFRDAALTIERLRSTAPANLCDFFDATLARSPARRPQSASDLVAALARLELAHSEHN